MNKGHESTPAYCLARVSQHASAATTHRRVPLFLRSHRVSAFAAVCAAVVGAVTTLLWAPEISAASGDLTRTTPLTGSVSNRGKESRRAAVTRDSFGVPHVSAGSRQALFYGVGLAQAEDRLWQMELLRRFGHGTAAEVLGPDLLEQDIFARTLLRSRDDLREQFNATQAWARRDLEAFISGVNAYISEADSEGKLPREFLGKAPSPWVPEDVYAIFGFLALNFGIFGNDEAANLALLADLQRRLGPSEGYEVFDDARWLDDPSTYVTLPDANAVNRSRAATTQAPKVAMHSARLARKYAATLRELRATQKRQRIARAPASYAVAISPKLSRDGRALLLSGPQVGYTAPGLFLEFGVHGGGYHAAGVGVPGMPFLFAGATRTFAWTLTTGLSNSSDLVLEELNPDAPSQYLFNGKYLELDCRTEVFHVLGGAPVARALCASVHGPIVQVEGNLAFAYQSPLPDFVDESVAGLLELSRTNTLRGFERALSHIALNFNLFFADRKGNIAWWHIGKFALRPEGVDPRLPLSGTGEQEWRGFVPFEDLPKALNPRQGFLVNWNNRPTSDWSYTLAGAQGPVQRVVALAHHVTAYDAGSFTLDTLDAINRAASSTSSVPTGTRFNVPAPIIGDLLLDHVAIGANRRLAEAVSRMRGWNRLNTDADHDGSYDDPAVAIFEPWFERLSEAIVGDELPFGTPLLTTPEDTVLAANILARIYAPEPGLPLLHDYLDKGQTTSGVATTTLITTLDALTKEYGTDKMSAWLRPVVEQSWRPQGAGTVPNTEFKNRGSYNQLTTWGRRSMQAINILPPGQSGNPISPHFDDQLELYSNFVYKPMLLRPADIAADAVSVRMLEPDFTHKAE